MAASRPVKTLTALFAAMTLGAFVLMLLETAPVRPTAHLAVLAHPPAGAAVAVRDAAVRIETSRWRYAVVHAAPAGGRPPAGQCHFLVGPDGQGGWRVTATDFWRTQQPGGHISGYWRDASIGICLIGDFSTRPPAHGQFEALVDLVNTLQETCGISGDRVYLHRDLLAGSFSPGVAFPVRRFSARLLRPDR